MHVQWTVEGREVRDVRPDLQRERWVRGVCERVRAVPQLLPDMHAGSRLQRKTCDLRDGQCQLRLQMLMREQLDGQLVRNVSGGLR